jgi:serine-type D-Ala-D-Ala carboxypeptidase/endopeptidase (penicillin-binding protein 4)
MKITLYHTSLLLLLIALFLSPQKTSAQKLTRRKIEKIVRQSELLKKHFVGLSIYDEDKGKLCYELNADKHFIPASNTKIATLYSCLEMLPDSIPALKYTVKKDTLYFWGTGDPTLGYADFKSDKVIAFLKKSNKTLCYIPGNYIGNFYGYGWNYDDYQEYYQVEKTAFPIDGNTVVITSDNKQEININPKRLSVFFNKEKQGNTAEFSVNRALFSNTFSYPENSKPKPNYYQEIPLKTSFELSCLLLEDKIGKPIVISHVPFPKENQILYSEKTDDVLRQMMLTSDNFLAEQLLLLCAATIGNELNTETIISHVKKQWISELSTEIEWVDGSGLSRFNLFSPNSFITILKKIKSKINNDQRLQSLFPAGGLTGTLKRAYPTDDGKAFVWAKTGTLTNNYNQSGFLNTKKGKKLIFSFMNNNFLPDAPEIRKEMVRILTEIHDKY